MFVSKILQLLRFLALSIPDLEEPMESTNETETIPKFMILGPSTIEFFYPTQPELNYQVPEVAEAKSFLRTSSPFLLAENLYGNVVLQGGKRPDAWNEHTTQTLIYDSTENIWFDGPNSTFIHYWGAAAVLNHTLFLCGGYEKNYTRQNGYAHPNCETYTTGAASWQQIPSMLQARKRHLAAECNGLIFMISGSARKRLDSIESYNPETDQWTDEGLIHNPDFYTSIAAVAVLDNFIYVNGGTTFVRFDPSKPRLALPPYIDWEVMPDSASRTNHQLVPFEGKLMTFGGTLYTEYKANDKISSYDPVTEKWTDLNETMITARYNFKMVVLEEKRDAKTREWTNEGLEEWREFVEEEETRQEESLQRYRQLLAALNE